MTLPEPDTPDGLEAAVRAAALRQRALGFAGGCAFVAADLGSA